MRRVGADEDIELRRHSSGAYTVHGLVRCGLWTCPCCGPQRARQTAGALAVAFKRHMTPPPTVVSGPLALDRTHEPKRPQEHANEIRLAPRPTIDPEPFTHDVWMLTLTMPHYAHESPVDVVDRLYAASQNLWRSSAWRRFQERWGIIARVRVLDATHGGDNGSHPHFHVALFPTKAIAPTYYASEWRYKLADSEMQPLSGATKDVRQRYLAEEVREELLEAWADAVREAGTRIEHPTEFRASGLQLTPSEAAAAYFTKWGLADEIGASTAKSRTHLRLLDAVHAGVDAAGDVFLAWRAATNGRQWVSGLADAQRAYAVSADDIAEHLEALREKRDAELTRAGKPPVQVRPLTVLIRPHLYAGALAAMRPTLDDDKSAPTGWNRLFAFIDAVDARGGNVQLEFEGELWRARVHAKRERFEDFVHRTGASDPTQFSSAGGVA